MNSILSFVDRPHGGSLLYFDEVEGMKELHFGVDTAGTEKDHTH